MNRTQKFALNSLTTALQQIITMLVGFITPALMIKTYGSEVNGLVSSINQVIAYISLVEAGLSGAAVYSLYKPLAEKHYSEINGIVSAAKKYYFNAGYMFSAVAFIIAVVYACMKSVNDLAPLHVFILTLLLCVNGCIDFFLLARYRVILTADQRTYILSIVGIFQTICKALIIILATIKEIDIITLYALTLIPTAIKTMVLQYVVKKKYAFLDFREKPNYVALGRRYDVVYQQILGTIQTGAPTVIATLFLPLINVSIYSVYNMVIGGINGILSIFVSSLPAGFGEIIAKNETDILKKTTNQFEVAYYFILSVVYGLTFVLILPFISVYTKDFSDANYYLPSLAFLITLNGLFYNIKTPQSMLIISAGLYRETRWRVTIQGIIIVLGGCFLVKPMGLEGIMIASIISNVVRTVDLLYFVPKYITHRRVWESLKRMVLVCINVGIIFVPSIVISFVPQNYVQWILMAIGYGAYAFAVSFIFVWLFDRDELKALVKRFAGIIRR